MTRLALLTVLLLAVGAQARPPPRPVRAPARRAPLKSPAAPPAKAPAALPAVPVVPAAAPASPAAEAPAPAAPVEPLLPTKRAAPAPPQVASVTAGQAFLNRGEQDGVAVGQSVTFTRGGRPAGSCQVDAASPHWARCAAGGLRRGDRFALKKASAAPAPAAAIPQPVSADLLAQRRTQLTAHVAPLVEYQGGARAGGRGTVVSAALSHTSASNLASGAGPFQQQRLDVALHDVELYRGLRASADLTVLNFSVRPDGFRSALRGTPSLLVRQLELGFRRQDVAFAGAVGRTWLKHAPGLLVVDGAQASWRAAEDRVELGVYGGLLPPATTLTLTAAQWAVGGYAMGRAELGNLLLQPEARVGWATKDGLGGRLEAAAAVHLYRGRTLDAHAAVEAGFGAGMATAGIDAARLDLGAQPADVLRLSGGLRYRGASPSGVVELGIVTPGQRALHGDLAVTLLPSQTLWLSAVGSAAADFDFGLTQARVGPELTLPRLFGGAGAVGLSYFEELGWLRGREVAVRTQVTLFERVRLSARAAWLHQQAGVLDTEGLASSELAGSLGVDVRIVRWLWARASGFGRVQLSGDAPLAGAVTVQLGGAL